MAWDLFEPDEQVLLESRPNPLHCVKRRFPIAQLVAFLITFVMVVGLSYLSFINDALLLMASCPMILGALLISMLPLFVYQDACQTRYIITNKRILCIVTGWFKRVTAYSVLNPRCCDALMNSDGTSDLVFAKKYDRVTDEQNITHETLENVGIIGMKDVTVAMDILQSAAINHFSYPDQPFSQESDVEELDPLTECIRSYLEVRQERLVWTARPSPNLSPPLPLPPSVLFKALFAYMVSVLVATLAYVRLISTVSSICLLILITTIYRSYLTDWEKRKKVQTSMAYVVSDKGLHICSLGGSREVGIEPGDVSVIETREFADRSVLKSASLTSSRSRRTRAFADRGRSPAGPATLRSISRTAGCRGPPQMRILCPMPSASMCRAWRQVTKLFAGCSLPWPKSELTLRILNNWVFRCSQ